MKKYLINIAIFFAIVAVVDFALGKVFYKVQSTYAKGGTGSEYYICSSLQEDVLIMGSSRAAHHYVSQIISDSLGFSCYNGGQDGNGIVMQYGRWKMISKHRVPKLIIYDIEPAFDLSIDDNSRYIDRLKPFAEDKDVKSYIAGLFPMEKYKLLSGMYRYNYKFLEIVSDCIRPSAIYDGYKPNYNHIRKELVEKEPSRETITIGKIDDVKIDCLDKLISEAQVKGVRVVLVSSPYWKGTNDYDMSFVQNYAEKKGVPFFDFSNSDIRNNPDWFGDSMHLNDEGAKVFTKGIITIIMDYFSQ